MTTVKQGLGATILFVVTSSILFSPNGLNIINDIRQHDPNLKFVVSSNLRDAKRQAIEVDRMVRANPKKIYMLYKAPYPRLNALKVASLSGGVDEVEKVIIKQQEEGFYLSRHMCGKALDIYPYKNNLTMKQLYDKVKNMRGYKVLNEGNHIHIQTIDGC
jgi:hypothetical protein